MFFEASRLLEYVDRRSWTKRNRELSLKWSSPRPCSFRSSNFLLHGAFRIGIEAGSKAWWAGPAAVACKGCNKAYCSRTEGTWYHCTSVVSKIIKLQWFRAPIKKCVLFWMLCYWCCHISNKMLFGVKSVDHRCSTLHLFNEEVSWNENPI